jgi:hypothetical protein
MKHFPTKGGIGNSDEPSDGKSRSFILAFQWLVPDQLLYLLLTAALSTGKQHRCNLLQSGGDPNEAIIHAGRSRHAVHRPGHNLPMRVGRLRRFDRLPVLQNVQGREGLWG